MKPTADAEDILTGEASADHLYDHWDDIGAGMVEAEVIGPWLIISRKGSDYRAFISVVDDQIVTVLSPEATTRHIPKEYRPDTDIPDDRYDALGKAFEGSSGMYPLSDEGCFQMGFKHDGDYVSLRIGLTDDTFEVVDEP